MTEKMIPGEILCEHESLDLFNGRNSIQMIVANTGDRPVQVGSHFHFFEVNKALDFDRAAAYGFRLAIASGTAVRFEPGQKQEVELVEMQGEREVHGLNGLVNGKLDDAKVRAAALKRAAKNGFKGAQK